MTTLHSLDLTLQHELSLFIEKLDLIASAGSRSVWLPFTHLAVVETVKTSARVNSSVHVWEAPSVLQASATPTGTSTSKGAQKYAPAFPRGNGLMLFDLRQVLIKTPQAAAQRKKMEG